jgi:hypothetical protein
VEWRVEEFLLSRKMIQYAKPSFSFGSPSRWLTPVLSWIADSAEWAEQQWKDRT